VLATQKVISGLADRIERSYTLRRPWWPGGACSTARVWSVAAEALWRAHHDDPSVPADPEFFVASQPMDQPYPDPWLELTAPAALAGYRRRVREVVKGLRRELGNEVAYAGRRVAAGAGLTRVLSSPGRLSPLGRYIIARSNGRPALADRFSAAAAEQHRACPLYRQAAEAFLPAGDYPFTDGPPRAAASPAAGPARRPLIEVRRN